MKAYLIPTLAVAGIIGALLYVADTKREVPPAKPLSEPAASNFQRFIAGSGIIEASSENIAIGTSIPGLVQRIYVQVGNQVKAGDKLFLVDDREARAQLALKQSELSVAKSQVAEAQAQLADMQNQLQIAQTLAEKSVASKFDRDRKKYSAKVAQARLEAAQSQEKQAQSAVDAVQTDLDRLLVKAPVDGEVLKINVRLGEFAPTGVLKDPLVLLGKTDPLHVRVDIDENDAWRFMPGAKAEGALRGNQHIRTPLEYVRTESYVLPKRSLTGDSTERVDTRVLQVIYRFHKGDIPAYVGQLMDVFIDAEGQNADAANAKPESAEPAKAN